jgi:hypothetical protein
MAAPSDVAERLLATFGAVRERTPVVIRNARLDMGLSWVTFIVHPSQGEFVPIGLCDHNPEAKQYMDRTGS